MKRSSPSGGYDFGAKRQYRREVWATLARFCPVKRWNADVLLMPSSEGAEIPVALSKGFQECRMHAVDANAAIIATAPWRKDFPAIHGYGNELPRACERIAAKGVKLAVANFDLCSNVTDRLLEDLSEIGATGVLSENAAVSITVLRGREDKRSITSLRECSASFFSHLSSPFPDSSRASKLFEQTAAARFEEIVGGSLPLAKADFGRVIEAFGVLAGSAKLCFRIERVAIYRSHASTMLWAVAAFRSFASVKEEVERFSASMQISMRKVVDAFLLVGAMNALGDADDAARARAAFHTRAVPVTA